MSGKNRILFVDDEENVLMGYSRSLHGKFCIDTSADPLDALALIEANGPYAVVVADMRMPGIDGMELLARLKVSHPDTVRMMVTGNADQKTAVEAVNKGGVYRFLNKPCDREMLIEALNDALALYDRMQEEKARLDRSMANVSELTERLSYETRHDLLTGLYNRHAFEQSLRQCLSQMGEAGASHHVLCHLDLDHFHVVNEIHGQLAGDALLRAVADLLSTHCRVNDRLGRVAGDDFCLLLYDCPLDQAKLRMDKLFRALAELSFEWNARPLDIRVSAGLVSVDGPERDAAVLLADAETACHVALDQGGGQLHIAGPQDDLMTERFNQAQWVSEISSALREDRFRLYAQRIEPIGRTGNGDHYELLLRMQDDEGRLLPPGLFLGVAEQFNLSTKIDLWVIGKTAGWLATNPLHLQRLSICAINLSGHSIGDRAVLEQIKTLFAEAAVPSRKICFEITETAAVSKLNDAVHFISELQALGFSFALDDFGSGLSSFGYLKNLPVDYIKIDGQFIRQLDADPVNRAMVSCINKIAKIMGKQTIAEYVENARVLAYLKEIGVDYAQGYQIARPCPLEALPQKTTV